MVEPKSSRTKKRVSAREAVVRAVFGVAMFGLSLWLIDRIAAAFPIAVVGIVLLATAVTRECPVYSMLAAVRDRSTNALSPGEH